MLDERGCEYKELRGCPSPLRNTRKETHAALFLFWLFSCRKWSRSLTKTNKYFIQCIMCAVWSTREKEKKRASSGVHMLWIPNDTPVNVTGTVAQRGNAQGCYTMESSIYFNTPFPFLVSAPLSLFTVPSSLSYSQNNALHSHTQMLERCKPNFESSL